ncbi:MAG TPA: 50S ribosomal protein L25 [Planctomycetota bacterium]|nr:50S ribosomal protein L25 [Planctomycetota bacterium]
MQIVQLPVMKREKVGSSESRRLRRDGRLPVTLDGLGRPSNSLSIDGHQFRLQFERGNRMFELTMDGKTQLCLVKDIHYAPVGETFLHLDLWRVENTSAIEVNVPLIFVGDPTPVSGATVDYPMHEIKVSCLPKDIPKGIDVQVGSLGVGQHITAGQVVLPAGLKLACHPDQTVVSFHYKSVEAEPSAGAAPAEPELLRKPKPTDDKA